MASKSNLPEQIIDVHNHLHGDDSDASKLLALMDECNIEKTLIMGGPSNFDFRNEALVKACHRHPDRLVGGAFYDPRDGKKAIDALAHFNTEGMRIVKLFPNFGYYPDEDSVRPFFEKVAELGMGVLSHCGWLAPQPGMEVAAYYAHPGRFEKIIRVFPDTIFIMAHMGGIAGFLESVMLSTRTPNTYIDCSPGQGLWALECGGAIAGSIPSDKLMWGSDCYDQPGMLERYVPALEKLGYGPDFEKIFRTNALGIFEKLGVV